MLSNKTLQTSNARESLSHYTKEMKIELIKLHSVFQREASVRKMTVLERGHKQDSISWV